MAISDRGFASMDPAKQRAIASKGGKASHSGGRTAHTRSSGAAGKTSAAKKGGMNSSMS